MKKNKYWYTVSMSKSTKHWRNTNRKNTRIWAKAMINKKFTKQNSSWKLWCHKISSSERCKLKRMIATTTKRLTKQIQMNKMRCLLCGSSKRKPKGTFVSNLLRVISHCPSMIWTIFRAKECKTSISIQAR